MTRKKVKLAFISNDATRKATYKKRKKGLMKKVEELTTLCGIDACAIIYSPYDEQPDVWPDIAGVERVVEKFKSMPEMQQSRKMLNQESFTRQRIAKTNEQLKKQLKENREKEMTEVMSQCLTGQLGLHNLMLPDLNDLGFLVDQKLQEINKKMNEMALQEATQQQQVVTPEEAPQEQQVVPTTVSDNVGVLAGGVVEEQRLDAGGNTDVDAYGLVPQWFNNDAVPAMTRKKVKLAFISNDATRKATYKKRKKGLMKKVEELSTLCGIDACAIIYSPYDEQPDVWPDIAGVERVVEKFKSMPEMQQSRKMLNQESFTRQRIAKTNEQLKKQLRDNREKEMTEVMSQCLTGQLGLHNLTLPDLNDLGFLVDQKLQEINKKMNEISLQEATQQEPVVIPEEAPQQQQVVPTTVSDNVGLLAGGVFEEQRLDIAGGSSDVDAYGLVPQWFNDAVVGNNATANDQNLGFMNMFGDENNPAAWDNYF
ncbi:hypothetical protein ACET3Z_008039 [Daucus carota]